MPNSDAVLETEALTIRFGGLVAVRDFSVRIPRGSIVGLIGPNGAGKTTCFNMVTGFTNHRGRSFSTGRISRGGFPTRYARPG